MDASPTLQTYTAPIPDAALQSAGAIMRACFNAADAEDDFEQRVAEKHKPLLILAELDTEPVGFKLGFELSRGVFTSWLGGTLPSHHRQGIATAMLRAQHAWVARNGYHTLLTESANRFRGMVILNLLEGFEIVGTEWSLRRQSLGIKFAKRFGSGSA